MPRRLDKESLFRDLGYQPHPAQLLVHRSDAPRRVLATGARFGKSTCAAYEAIVALLEPRAATRGWIVAPTYALTRAIFDLVRMTFLQGLRHYVVEDDERALRLVVHNLSGGLSELVAKSADHSASLLGEAVDFVIVDEAARLAREIWEHYLSQRLVDRDGWALLISTPKGTTWFFELFRRGQKGRDPAFESWRFPTWANPHLDRELIKAERSRLSPEAFQQEYEARFLGEEYFETCEVCGRPREDSMAVVVLHEGEELGTCADCAGRVDPRGRSVEPRRKAGQTACIKIRRMSAPESPEPPEPPAEEAAPPSDPFLNGQVPERN